MDIVPCLGPRSKNLGEPNAASPDPINTALGLLVLFGPEVYLAAMWAFRGQTIGMTPFGLKVVRASNGERISIWRALLRIFGMWASLVLWIGLIWAPFDSRKQGWRDKIADTFVFQPVKR
jgi:uncharacterized RDD family membrane protein YckC